MSIKLYKKIFLLSQNKKKQNLGFFLYLMSTVHRPVFCRQQATQADNRVRTLFYWLAGKRAPPPAAIL